MWAHQVALDLWAVLFFHARSAFRLKVEYKSWEGGDINKGKSIQHTDLRYLEEKKNYDFQQSGDGIGKLKKLSVN